MTRVLTILTGFGFVAAASGCTATTEVAEVLTLQKPIWESKVLTPPKIGEPIWGPVIVDNQPLNRPTKFDRIGTDGMLYLKDGRSFRLAGLQMRSVGETHEPTGLTEACRLIGDEVEIVTCGSGVEAFYKKGKNYYCKEKYKLPHPLTVRHYEKKYDRESVNEMLIETGLARWDTGSNCDSATQNRLATMQRRYDEKLRALPTEAVRDQSRNVFMNPVAWRDRFSWRVYRSAAIRMVRPCVGDLERIGLIQASAGTEIGADQQS